MTQNVISLTIYKQNEREAINHWFSHIRYWNLYTEVNCETIILTVFENTNGTPEYVPVATEEQKSLPS